jgi:hypothetical protein
VTNVICESLKESYSVQGFLNSQTMEKASVISKGHTLGPARQDDL